MMTPAGRMRSEAAEAVAAHETIRRLRARRRAEIEQLVALANEALDLDPFDAVAFEIARSSLADACGRLDPDEREALFWKLAA